MANLRIIYKNIADEGAVSADSTVTGVVGAISVQNDFKGQVHRSDGTSVVFTFTWSASQSIGGCFFMTNLSADATGRLQLYSDEACTAQIGDTGTLNVAQGSDLELWNWSEPLNVNAFAFGGMTKSALWFDNQIGSVRGAKLTLSDAGNDAGYIDTARIGMGAYWEAPYAPESVEPKVVDTTQNTRNDAGDNMSDRGTQHDQMTINLRGLSTTDRATLMRIARHNGKFLPLFISVFPADDDPVLEQDHMIYGKFSNDASVPEDVYLKYLHKREVEGW
jgi:hypothetical protein